MPIPETMVTLSRNRARVAVLKLADLEIDALDPLVRQGSRAVRLSPIEHVLLYRLASRVGVVISYRELAGALGRDAPTVNNSIARHVSSLRSKLRDDSRQPRYIETVPGIGFRFVVASETKERPRGDRVL
jgi:Response regulators consisting of a CheY-like receiver domain and a winged-helix DNA-binding domain